VSETTWYHRCYGLITWGLPALFVLLGLAACLRPAPSRDRRPGGLTL
jgi:hypothetical protein